MNNIGEQVFTFKDYFRFNGGIGNRGGKGASMQLSSESLGLMPMQENRANQMTTQVGALNFTYHPTKEWSFDGFAILSEVETTTKQLAQRVYVNQTALNELFSATNQQPIFAGIAKLKSQYKGGNNWHVEHQIMLRKSTISDQQQLLTENDFTQRYYDTDYHSQVPSLEQQLSVYWTVHPKHILSVEVEQLANHQKKDYLVGSNEEIFSAVIPIKSTDSIQLFQTEDLRTQKWGVDLNHYWILNATNHFSINVGTEFNDQQLATSLYQQPPNNSEATEILPSLSNDFDYLYRDWYIGLNYKSKIYKLTIKPGVHWHFFENSHTALPTRTRLNRRLLLPHFEAKYDFNKTVNLAFDYRIQTTFYDAPWYASGSVMKSYNQLYTGNAQLENSWYHQLNLSYYSWSLYNFTNIYAMLSYQRKYDDVNEQVSFEELDRIASPINVNRPNDYVTAFANLDKRFKHFKTTISTDFSYSKFSSLLDDQTNTTNTNFSQRYRASIETTMEDLPIIEIGITTLLNTYRNKVFGTQQFTTLSPAVNIEWSIWGPFLLTADYSYHWYQSQGGEVDSQYDLLNAALYYKGKDSRFEFKLTGLNLLNTSSIRRDRFTEVFSSTNEYFIQPRYILGSIQYEF